MKVVFCISSVISPPFSGPKWFFSPRTRLEPLSITYFIKKLWDDKYLHGLLTSVSWIHLCFFRDNASVLCVWLWGRSFIDAVMHYILGISSIGRNASNSFKTSEFLTYSTENNSRLVIASPDAHCRNPSPKYFGTPSTNESKIA